MGCNYYAVKKKPTVANALHIGKSSAGWKFLFHEINSGCCEYDNDLEIHTYNQWIEYLSKNKDDIIILNEYDEEISLEYFIKIVQDRQSIENKDNFTYSKNIDGYRFTNGEFS